MEKKIRVSMTSWQPRIKNVKAVIESILNQTVMPDSVELNLAKPNFIEIDEKGNEKINLPNDLVDFIDKHDNVNLNWTDKDTKTFKKLIPTLQKYYGEDYYVLTIDDDMLYKRNYIEKMLNWIKDKKSDSFCICHYNINGGRMIYKSTAFQSDYWENIPDEIIQRGINDYYIQLYLEKHGKKMAHLNKDDTSLFTVYNEVKPLHDIYNKGNYVSVTYNIIRRHFNKNALPINRTYDYSMNNINKDTKFTKKMLQLNIIRKRKR